MRFLEFLKSHILRVILSRSFVRSLCARFAHDFSLIHFGCCFVAETSERITGVCDARCHQIFATFEFLFHFDSIRIFSILISDFISQSEKHSLWWIRNLRFCFVSTKWESIWICVWRNACPNIRILKCPRFVRFNKFWDEENFEFWLSSSIRNELNREFFTFSFVVVYSFRHIARKHCDV